MGEGREREQKKKEREKEGNEERKFNNSLEAAAVPEVETTVITSLPYSLC